VEGQRRTASVNVLFLDENGVSRLVCFLYEDFPGTSVKKSIKTVKELLQ
jgi:hypothetical protein